MATTTDLQATAEAAAQAAAEVHRDAARDRSRLRVGSKTGHSDFVSEVDLAAQSAALAVVGARHPTHQIMAEEAGGARPGAPGNERLWLVDPLDGTTNFLHGHPFYAASVAVWDGDGPLAGAVRAHALGKSWTAARGEGAFEDGEPIRTSRTEDLAAFLLGAGFPFKFPALIKPFLAALGRALRRTSGVRRTGAASLDLAYVASGRLDGFWEDRLCAWDFGAGALLVTEAGGAVGRIEGGSLSAAHGSVLAANSARSLARLRELLTGQSPEPSAATPTTGPSRPAEPVEPADSRASPIP